MRRARARELAERTGRAQRGRGMSWVLAFAGFAVLIILHEAGHFVAAKAVGMRVERFFLFFPPKLWSVKRGETEYGIGAIPLGGFVKITGMNPDEELDPEVAPRAYYNQPVWKRIVVIGAGPFVNLVIAFVILFFLAFRRSSPTSAQVDEVAAGHARRRRCCKPGDRADLGRRRQRGDQIALREQLATPRRCAGEQTDGCRADEPAELVVVRDGREVTVDGHAPSTTRRPSAAAARLRLRQAASTRALGRRRGLVARPDVGRDLADGQRSSGGSSTPSSASRSPASSAAMRSPGSRSSSTPARRCSCSR